MKPITASVSVKQHRDEVFSFLDVLANHEQFTDHMLVDWSFAGPGAGVGARARMRAKGAGNQWMDLEALESEPPVRTVEETIGAHGKRHTRGTYTLDELPDGGTEIHFQLEVIRAPLAERVLAPAVRAYMKRANAKALRRLAQALDGPRQPQAEASR